MVGETGDGDVSQLKMGGVCAERLVGKVGGGRGNAKKRGESREARIKREGGVGGRDEVGNWTGIGV